MAADDARASFAGLQALIDEVDKVIDSSAAGSCSSGSGGGSGDGERFMSPRGGSVSYGEHPPCPPDLGLFQWQHQESVRRVFQEAIQTPEGRDALVQRCCASVAPEDRQGFIDELQRVAGPLSQDSLSRCLHAFHLMHPLVRSNAQKRAVRRGPRPRRRKVLEEAGVDAGLTHDADATGPPATGGDGAQGLAEWSTARPLAGWGTLPLATGGLALNLRTGCLEACRAAGADDNLNAPDEATTGQPDPGAQS